MGVIDSDLNGTDGCNDLWHVGDDRSGNQIGTVRGVALVLSDALEVKVPLWPRHRGGRAVDRYFTVSNGKLGSGLETSVEVETSVAVPVRWTSTGMVVC